MIIKLIACVDRKGAIGYNNKLLFNIPEDMKRFKELTSGHCVVMGRKTFESLPNGPLKNRGNFILSSKYPLSEDYSIYTSVEHILKGARHHPYMKSKVLWVIGGANVYQQFLRHAKEIELTVVESTKRNVDAYFPIIDTDKWAISNESDTKEHKGLKYRFVTYTKKD